LDGTADRTALQRRRVLRRWLLAYPVVALALSIYAVATSARTDMGEFLLLAVVAAGAALAMPLLALIDGARCRTIGAAVGGCLLGIVPALLVVACVTAADQAYFEHTLKVQRERMARLLDASVRGDRDGVRAAMATLADEYDPAHALCLIGAAGRSQDWVLPEPDGGALRVPTARLFDAAEALMRDLPRAQRQAVLGALLVRLSERDDAIGYLRGWLRLWRDAQAERASRTLGFAQPRADDSASDCHLDSDADLARIVADTWHDDGLRAWIAAGYGFSAEQGPPALDGLRSEAGLDALLAAGFDLRAALRRPVANNEAMHQLAARLPLRLDQSDDPAALAGLTEAYLRAGAELGRTRYGKTLCETFRDAELSQAADRASAPAAARTAAAQRIDRALCPQGRPPAPTSSSTTPYEDSLAAAADAASAAAQREASGSPEPRNPEPPNPEPPAPEPATPAH